MWAAYLRAFISQGLQDLAASRPSIQHCSFHIPRNICCFPRPSEPWGCFQEVHKRKMLLHYLPGPEKVHTIHTPVSRMAPTSPSRTPKGVKLPWQERKPQLVPKTWMLCPLPILFTATVAIFMIVSPPPSAQLKNSSQPLPSSHTGFSISFPLFSNQYCH